MDATSKHNDNPDTDNVAIKPHQQNRQKMQTRIRDPRLDYRHSEDTPPVWAKENLAPWQQSP
jgi:hypothetical protein